MRQIQALGFEPKTKTVTIDGVDIVVRALTQQERENSIKLAKGNDQVLGRMMLHIALELEPADTDSLLRMPVPVFDTLLLAVNELNIEEWARKEELEGECETPAPPLDGSIT